MTGPPWAPLFLAVIGVSVGSFLNVVIYRLPRRQSLAWPGSFCPACRAPIRLSDNVPVLGWLILRGRCRACRAPISIRYLIVEAITGAVFLLHLAVFGWEPILIPRLLFACAMIALFAIDLEHKLLPNAITLPGIAAGLAFSLVFPPGPLAAAIGVVAGYGSLWLVAVAWELFSKKEAMGGGDLKMLGMIGAFLGWQGVIVTFMLGFMVGGVFSGALLAARRVGLASQIPFGTFLAVGALIASLWGPALIEWYVGFYR
jgi:leader peptidase (prepilin peptidase) / N-methyltransferase